MSKNVKTTIAAGEDLSASTCLYHAVALDDGQLAANGLEAGGILYNDPDDTQHATLGFLGEMRYAAGAAISVGAKLTVTTSGWLTTCASGSVSIGRSKTTVSSGAVGMGLFDFSNPVHQVSSL